MKKRRRKYQDLAAIKARWSLFQQISADTKDLDDIPHYWPQAQALGFPLIQYTAREVRSGLLFLTFSQQRSAAASAVLAARFQSTFSLNASTLLTRKILLCHEPIRTIPANQHGVGS